MRRPGETLFLPRRTTIPSPETLFPNTHGTSSISSAGFSDAEHTAPNEQVEKSQDRLVKDVKK